MRLAKQTRPRDDTRFGVPPQTLASALISRGGAVVLEGLLDPDHLALLRNEAAVSWGQALAQDNNQPNEEERGGTPPRRFLSANGGIGQRALYHSPRTLAALTALAGAPVRPTGECGTFTYYIRGGDHLALHRDIPRCDIALISVLEDYGKREPSAGALCVYPHRYREALATIRRTLNHGAYTVEATIGQSIVILGGTIPHQVLPVTDGQKRIISVLCFELLA